MKQRRALFYVPAFAALVAPLAALPAPVEVAASPDGMSLTLHDDVGPCVNGAKIVIWQSADKRKAVPGCYLIVGDVVSIGFLDGDSVQLPRAIFRRVKDS